MSLNLRSDANFESHLGVQSFELAASNDIESARQNQRFSETKRGTVLGTVYRRKHCTGFCTDCLHPGLTGAYWPFRGTLLEVIDAKGRRFIIRSL
jgi:hypothetical protein